MVLLMRNAQILRHKPGNPDHGPPIRGPTCFLGPTVDGGNLHLVRSPICRFQSMKRTNSHAGARRGISLSVAAVRCLFLCCALSSRHFVLRSSSWKVGYTIPTEPLPNKAAFHVSS